MKPCAISESLLFKLNVTEDSSAECLPTLASQQVYTSSCLVKFLMALICQFSPIFQHQPFQTT